MIASDEYEFPNLMATSVLNYLYSRNNFDNEKGIFSVTQILIILTF